MRKSDKIALDLLRAGSIRVDSRHGEVYGILGRPLKPTIHNGYACVGLRYTKDDGERESRKVYVHRLIWLATRGEIPAGQCITHKRPPDTDNRLRNLKLGRKAIVRKTRLTARQVSRIRRHKRLTQKALAAKFGVTQSSISHILNRRTWQSGNHRLTSRRTAG